MAFALKEAVHCVSEVAKHDNAAERDTPTLAAFTVSLFVSRPRAASDPLTFLEWVLHPSIGWRGSVRLVLDLLPRALMYTGQNEAGRRNCRLQRLSSGLVVTNRSERRCPNRAASSRRVGYVPSGTTGNERLASVICVQCLRRTRGERGIRLNPRLIPKYSF